MMMYWLDLKQDAEQHCNQLQFYIHLIILPTYCSRKVGIQLVKIMFRVFFKDGDKCSTKRYHVTSVNNPILMQPNTAYIQKENVSI